MSAEEPTPMSATRRALMEGSIAAIAAGALPAMAHAFTADAELLAIGAEMDRLMPTLDQRIAAANLAVRAAKEHAVPLVSEARRRAPITADELGAIYHASEQAHGVYGEACAWEPLMEHLGALWERSYAIQATTMSGLIVKARIAGYWLPGSRAEHDPAADVEHMATASLVRDLLAMAG